MVVAVLAGQTRQALMQMGRDQGEGLEFFFLTDRGAFREREKSNMG
jgi:hypothetical protein